MLKNCLHIKVYCPIYVFLTLNLRFGFGLLAKIYFYILNKLISIKRGELIFNPFVLTTVVLTTLSNLNKIYKYRISSSRTTT